MSDKKNRSIAYIYDEMDPSEKLEFERDLQNDNNLLIEVESFKKVSGKLGDLQQIQPPQRVVEAVCRTAQNSSKSSEVFYGKPFFLAVAAVLLIGMTSGIFLMHEEDSVNNNSETESASVSTNPPIYSQPMNSSVSGDIEPWVDNNDILYFNTQTGSVDNALMDSIKNISLKKLTPVTEPSQIRPDRYYQLTGSHK